MLRAFGSTTIRQNEAFLKLWFGQTVSQLGSRVTVLALPTTAILILHATPFEVGLLPALQFLPFLLLGPLVGVWTDSTRRRPLMIAADLGRMVALASVPLAFAANVLTLAQLLVVSAVTGTWTVLSTVTSESYLPEIVPRADLTEANTKLQLSASSAAIAGPALAGFLINLVGATRAITVDAASFLVSAAALLWIRTPEPRGATQPQAGFLSQLREGTHAVLSDPIVRVLAINGGTVNFGNYTAYTVLLIFAYRELYLTPEQMGLVFALGSLGWFIGALLRPTVDRTFGVGRALIIANIVNGIGVLALPLAQFGAPMLVLAVAHSVTDIAWPIYLVNQQSLRQAIVPSHLQGRAAGVTRTLSNGIIPLGSVLGGALATTFGTVPVMVFGGLITLLSVLLLIASPVRRMDKLSRPPGR